MKHPESLTVGGPPQNGHGSRLFSVLGLLGGAPLSGPFVGGDEVTGHPLRNAQLLGEGRIVFGAPHGASLFRGSGRHGQPRTVMGPAPTSTTSGAGVAVF